MCWRSLPLGGGELPGLASPVVRVRLSQSVSAPAHTIAVLGHGCETALGTYKGIQPSGADGCVSSGGMIRGFLCGDSALLAHHNQCGLHGGVWGVDCVPW
jgi:hypothetical protein